MSLFGSLMGDAEDDSLLFGSQLRHMLQMNNMMSSLFDPFSIRGGMGPLAITNPHHGTSLMPFMPQMPSLNRLLTGNFDIDGHISAGSSYSSTIVMSSGPNGKRQVISSSSSTQFGPNGVKETRNTLQDSRTGTKKMSIGHHIGERAHVIEREQNYYSGEAEERQEFINIEEDEAEEFDREFQTRAGAYRVRSRNAIQPARRTPPQLALPAPPPLPQPQPSPERSRSARSAARRALRAAPAQHAAPHAAATAATATATSAHHSSGVREVYGGSHPQSHRHSKHHRTAAQRHPAHDN